jgi:hypothetical protein
MPSRQPRRRPRAVTQTSFFQDPPNNQLVVLPTASLPTLTALLARLVGSYRRRRDGVGCERGPGHG